MAKVSRRDLRKLADNSAKAMSAMEQRGYSLAVCFDALLSVMEKRTPGIEGELKEELERRKNANTPR